MAAFDEAARRAAVSAQSRMLDVPVASAPDVFAKVALRFDLVIMGQPEPDTPTLERLLGIEPHVTVFDNSARKDRTFSREDFTYDHAGDVYICPGIAGSMLIYIKISQCVQRSGPSTLVRLRDLTTDAQETAALRDFNLTYGGLGVNRIQGSRGPASRHVRFAPRPSGFKMRSVAK